ncbi:hypothetical protein MTO96_018912 [Rhipicephalus appendiculatus]
MVPLNARRAEARHYDNDRSDGGRQMRLHGRTARGGNRFTRIKRHQAERISRESGTLPTTPGIRRGRVRDSMRGHSFVTAASVAAGSDAMREKRGNFAITAAHSLIHADKGWLLPQWRGQTTLRNRH